MEEKTYRKQFEVSEEEISETWPLLQSVINAPSLEQRHNYDAWPRYPHPIFRESCDLALLGEDPFVSESEYNVFSKVLVEVDENGFMVLVRYGSEADKQYELFCYPDVTAWTTFNDDNPASQAIALSVLDHYIIGVSGRWGMFFVEPWNVYVVGYKDQKVLRAMQHTYNFEGRGAEVVDSLPKRRGTQRLHEIAAEIRAQDV